MDGMDRIAAMKIFDTVCNYEQAMAVLVLSGVIDLILPFVAKNWSYEQGCELMVLVVKGMKLAKNWIDYSGAQSNYLTDAYIARICSYFVFEGHLFWVENQDIVSLRLLIFWIDMMCQEGICIVLVPHIDRHLGWLVGMMSRFVFATNLVLTNNQRKKLMKSIDM